jgi:hypothetical protein
MPVIQMNAIPGYEMVPLLEALNGPYQPSDLTMAAASLARQEAVRALNSTEDGSELHPIAMTVIVAPLTDTTIKGEDEKAEKARAESPVSSIIHEISRKTSSTTKLSKSSSVDAKTPVTSDPEDEMHFSEAVETLPDLQDFGDVLDSASLNTRYDEKPHSHPSAPKQEEEEEMQLQSIEGSPVHTTNVLMIAAIDEFSDEEDTTRTRKNVIQYNITI